MAEDDKDGILYEKLAELRERCNVEWRRSGPDGRVAYVYENILARLMDMERDTVHETEIMLTIMLEKTCRAPTLLKWHRLGELWCLLGRPSLPGLVGRKMTLCKALEEQYRLCGYQSDIDV